MNQTIGIAIIISAIALVGMAAIAVNIPVPAHASQCWLVPGSGGFPCYPNRHVCDQTLPSDAVVTCHKR